MLFLGFISGKRIRFLEKNAKALKNPGSLTILPAQDPVLKDQVLNCNITHSKHGHATRKNKHKKDPVLNGECSPVKTGCFFLVI